MPQRKNTYWVCDESDTGTLQFGRIRNEKKQLKPTTVEKLQPKNNSGWHKYVYCHSNGDNHAFERRQRELTDAKNDQAWLAQYGEEKCSQEIIS